MRTTAPKPKPEPVLREYWCGAWQQQGKRQATTVNTKGNENVWRLAVKVVLPGVTCRGSVCRGAWCLAVRVPCQAA